MIRIPQYLKRHVYRYMPSYLSGVGILLLYSLHTLPRWVVDNEAERLRTEPSVHTLKMDVNLRMRVLGWKTQWQDTQSWIWADSLAQTYLQYRQIDSALYYTRQIRSSEDSAATTRAALHLFRAYDLSTDRSQWSRLATEARAQLQAAIQLQPKAYDLRIKLALSYLRDPQPMQGIQLLKQLQREVPHHPEVLFQLGRLALETGQYLKGEENLRKLLELYPLHMKGMLYLGRYLIKENQAEGTQILQRAKDICSDPALLQIINESLE